MNTDWCFNDDVFALYSSEQCASYAYNLARMQAKDILLQIAQAMEDRLSELTQNLVRESTAETPSILNHKRVESQWVYWSREPKQREALKQLLEFTRLSEKEIFNLAPQQKHINLCIALDSQGLFVGLHLAAEARVDRQNLLQKLEHTWQRDSFVEILMRMPADSQWLHGTDVMATGECNAASINELVQSLRQSSEPLRIGMAMDKPTLSSPDWVDKAIDCLAAAYPLYRFAAWSHDNDLINVKKKLQTQNVQKTANQREQFKIGTQVRILEGALKGQLGVVQGHGSKNQIKVVCGKLAVMVTAEQVSHASS